MSTRNVTLGPGIGGVGTGALAVSGSITLEGAGSAIAYALTNPNSPAYVEEKDLANGANTITIPAKAGGVVIMPDEEADFQATLKGVSGDTGIALAKRALSVLTFESPPPANFVLTWAGYGKLDVAVTADDATDKITLTSHGLADGTRVKFRATGATGVVPGGLVAGVLYYVVSSATNDFKVSATLGGTAIDLTGTGTNVKVSTVDKFKLFWF